MWYMEVAPFAEMNENFFYLCKDAIDDVESINFEVYTIWTHLLDLAKAFLGKGEFNMASNVAHDLDERIEEHAKHVVEMGKSLAEMKELIHQLEKGLKSTKAYLESLNQEKELWSS